MKYKILVLFIFFSSCAAHQNRSSTGLHDAASNPGKEEYFGDIQIPSMSQVPENKNLFYNTVFSVYDNLADNDFVINDDNKSITYSLTKEQNPGIYGTFENAIKKSYKNSFKVPVNIPDIEITTLFFLEFTDPSVTRNFSRHFDKNFGTAIFTLPKKDGSGNLSFSLPTTEIQHPTESGRVFTQAPKGEISIHYGLEAVAHGLYPALHSSPTPISETKRVILVAKWQPKQASHPNISSASFLERMIQSIDPENPILGSIWNNLKNRETWESYIKVIRDNMDSIQRQIEINTSRLQKEKIYNDLISNLRKFRNCSS